MMRRLFAPFIIIILCIASGCSGSNENPVAPVDVAPRDIESDNTHMLWGLYRFTADLEAQTLEFVPLRSAELHLNALPFLEPPALVYLSLESLVFNGNIIDADIGLRHPFLGVPEFTGYDVNGIFIANGSVTGFDDGDICTPGAGDTRLLNSDGFSRWWNPEEFPINPGTIHGYTDGLLGAPDSFADYSGTVNGYKYFCDDLTDPDASLTDVTPESRGMFSPGQKNVRHYTIEIGTDGLIFNYAVDASWVFPLGSPPWTAPDDFPAEANRPEPWWIDAGVTNNTLWNDGVDSGGALSLTIDVHDWYNIDLNTVNVESPGGFTALMDIASTGGGEGYSTYEVEIPSATPGPDEIQVLITVECEDENYGGFISGTNTAAYQLLNVPVNPEPADLEAYATAEIEPYFDGFGPEATSDDPIPTEWYLTLDASASLGTIAEYLWEMNGDDLYDDASGMIVSAGFPDPGTHEIKLKITNGTGGEDTYDLPGTYEVVTGTYADAAFTGGADGSRANPYPTISEAVIAVGTDGYILARGDNGGGGQNNYSADLNLGPSFNGSRIQGYYGDYDADQPALHTGYIKITGDNMIIDGFEVTGPSQADYQPYGWDSKLGVERGQDNLFRHIYIHDIGPHSGGDGFVSWDGAQMTIENCLINELNMSFMIFNRSHHNYANTDMINCTFDRLSSSVAVWSWYISGYGTASVNNCIWTDVGLGDNTRYLIKDGAGVYTITYNNCCDTATAPDGGQYYILNTGPHIPFDPEPGTGCITEDPLYVDPFSDHHLQTSPTMSPCIDTGDPAITDYDDSPSDFGCYGGPFGDWDFEN